MLFSLILALPLTGRVARVLNSIMKSCRASRIDFADVICNSWTSFEVNQSKAKVTWLFTKSHCSFLCSIMAYKSRMKCHKNSNLVKSRIDVL